MRNIWFHKADKYGTINTTRTCGLGYFMRINNIEVTDSAMKMLSMFMQDVFYTYEFDVTTGIVETDIIDKTGHNYTRSAGLSAPFHFDEMIARSFDEKFLALSYSDNSSEIDISCESLLNAYNEGRRKVEVCVHVPYRHLYNRITYMLTRDEASGHVRAFAYCQDVTDTQEKNMQLLLETKQELVETDTIVASAGIAIWKIELFDGARPKMYGTAKMYEMLGFMIDDNDISPEAFFIAWHSRIKQASLPIVDMLFDDMIKIGKAESTYRWVHPEKGDIHVRCGGTSYMVEDKGVVLRGYFYDVTDAIASETKQKELLSEALSEAEEQKKLLQQALDNYKQADYDRRTDFLTGLRNRQDMFEMLHDSLSQKRDQIKTMYMMDIDNFKQLNDHYGHSYGDECLKRIGAALIEYGKNNSMHFYRYGGEEILGIGFDNPKTDREIAEELVGLVRSLNIKRDDLPTGCVTISLGFTSNNKRYEKMIDKADTAMYRAKTDGKNRAVCFEDIK